MSDSRRKPESDQQCPGTELNRRHADFQSGGRVRERSDSGQLPGRNPECGAGVAKRRLSFRPGQVVGRSTIVRDVGNRRGVSFWLVRCECGSEREVRGSKLKTVGRCLMCRPGAAQPKDSLPEYKVWLDMKQRCGNPRSRCFRNYGGRGIRVCDRWLRSFDDFFVDMGRRPSSGHSLDRIDNDGNYEPGNVRWATKLEQAGNTRRAWITPDMASALRARMQAGEPARSVAETTGIPRRTINKIMKGTWRGGILLATAAAAGRKQEP